MTVKNTIPRKSPQFRSPLASTPSDWDRLLVSVFGCRPLVDQESLHNAVKCIEAMQQAAIRWSSEHTGKGGRLNPGVPFDLEYTFELEDHALELLAHVYAERARVLLETCYRDSPAPPPRVDVKIVPVKPGELSNRIHGILDSFFAGLPEKEGKECKCKCECGRKPASWERPRDKKGRFMKLK